MKLLQGSPRSPSEVQRRTAVTSDRSGRRHGANRALMGSSRALITRGDGLYLAGRFDKALSLYDRALQLLEGGGRHELRLQITCLNKFAYASLQRGLLYEAECVATRALNILYLQGWSGSSCAMRTHEILGLIYHAQRKYCKAEHMFSTAVSLARRIAGVGAGTLAVLMNRLAVVVASQGRLGEAIVILHGAIGILEDIPAGFTSDLTMALGNIAELYRGLGHLEISEVLYQRSRERLVGAFGVVRPNCYETRASLEAVYREDGQAGDRWGLTPIH